MKIYYTLNSEELGEEAKKETLINIYNEWLRYKKDDKETGDKKTYYFIKHEIENNVDNTTEGKVYKRGNQIYFKSI
jgi:hypothetical protein